MVNQNFKNWLFLYSIIVILNSCIPDNASNLGGTIYIQPEYALPIGNPNFDLATYLNTLGDLNPIDTLQLDTLNGFIYEDELYETPVVYAYSQKIPFSFSVAAITDEYITSAMFRTNVKNSIPAEVKIQIYFLDAAENLIDSLYNTGPVIINKAEVNSEGIVVKSSILEKYDTYFDENNLNRLTAVNSIDIYTTVHIENVQSTVNRYYSDQDFWLQLGVKFKTDLKLNE